MWKRVAERYIHESALWPNLFPLISPPSQNSPSPPFLSLSFSFAPLPPQGAFHCYPRLFGGHGRFFPHFAKVEAWREARPRIAQYRSAMFAHVGLAAASDDALTDHAGSILFVLRRKYRCVVNEAALVDAIGSDAQLSRIVTFVRFEELSPKPLIGQLRVVLRASAIAGVHGQGLVWTSMLSSTPSRGCALYELIPSAMAKVNTHSKYDYYRWTRLNECGYKSVVVPDSPECKGQYFRVCGNVTLPDLHAIMNDLKSVHAHVTKQKEMNAVSLH